MDAERILTGLASLGWKPGLTTESYEAIAQSNFRGIDSFTRVAILAELVIDNKPLTVRGLMYQAVSCGLLPDTSVRSYDTVVRLCGAMRRQGLIGYDAIVDNVRSTQKPSSWSGLDDFADTVRDAYRRDFWASLDNYCHVICEKDAIAGTLSPVTREFDVPLSPIRGYISDTYAWELGARWACIDKPIYVFYLGDYDPSGFDLEQNAMRKLLKHAGSSARVVWNRLGVNLPDFGNHNLVRLEPKASDTRTPSFIRKHGNHCAEVDALPPPELRRRVKDSIQQLIPAERWDSLRRVEALERATFGELLDSLPPSLCEPTGDSHATS